MLLPSLGKVCFQTLWKSHVIEDQPGAAVLRLEIESRYRIHSCRPIDHPPRLDDPFAGNQLEYPPDDVSVEQ